MKLGFIGTGVMGSAVARHLLEAGHEVAVYNRTKAKADPLVTEGAIWADTPKAVAEQSNILFTMVGYPKDVEEIYYGQSGIFSADISGHILVDLTTSTPSLAEKIAKTALKENTTVEILKTSSPSVLKTNNKIATIIAGTKSSSKNIIYG